MSQFAFHITSTENVEDIRENGLHSSTEGQWRQKRKELRQEIDSYAHKNFSGWVDRENAVFFWSKLSDAERFAEMSFSHIDEYVIVTVDLSSYTVWTTDNQLIEQLFETWLETGDIENKEQNLSELGSGSHEWSGKSRSSYELWCQGPISPSDITEIR